MNESTPVLPVNLPPILLDGGPWFVIDKPAGMAVHPGPKTPDSLEQLLPLYAPNRPVPQAVHRLDRDTSGCLLVSKRSSALRALSRAFEAGEVEKLYWGIVENPPAHSSGQIDAPLLKQSTRETGWRMVVDDQGKSALTEWEIVERRENLALVAFRPKTGRTHQIRVHATLMGEGCTLFGDPVYGHLHEQGMQLHSRSLSFKDPGTQESRTATAPMPQSFKDLGFTNPDPEEVPELTAVTEL